MCERLRKTMASSFWLKAGDKVGDEIEISSPLTCGQDWQIYVTAGQSRLLVARQLLVSNWVDAGLLDDDVFLKLKTEEETLYVIRSGREYALGPVDSLDQPDRKEDALSFAVSLKATREIVDDRPLGNPIFIERLSRFLPTNGDRLSQFENHEILGFWLSGGVKVSVLNFRKLYSLCWGIPVGDLAEVVKAGGFSVPRDAYLLGSAPGSIEKNRAEIMDEPGSKPDERSKGIADSSKSLLQDSEEMTAEFKLSGRPFLEEFFNEHVIDIIYNPERYQAVGIEFPSAIVLHGPPGCGKTFAVEKLSKFIDWPCFSIDSNSVGSPYIHET